MKKVFYFLIVLACINWSQAYADYLFTFESTDGTFNISGLLNTSPAGGGTLMATGGSATDSGVHGNLSFNLIPGSGISPSGAFTYDNILNSNSGPMLTNTGGLLFKSKSGDTELNIWDNDSFSYSCMEFVAGHYVPSLDWSSPTYGASLGRFTLTPAPVPVPAAAWLLTSGLVGLLGVRRRIVR